MASKKSNMSKGVVKAGNTIKHKSSLGKSTATVASGKMGKSDLKTATARAGIAIGSQDKLTRALIKAGSPKVKKNAKNSTISYKDFLDMSPKAVSHLTTEELRAVVARLNKVESKRVKNLEKQGYNTQALRALEETGGLTRAGRDMTRQQLLHEYKRAKSFLLSETSTVKGSKSFLEGISERLGSDREPTKEEISRLYDIVDKHKEEVPSLLAYAKGNKNATGYQYSLQVQNKVWDLMDQGKSDDEILHELHLMSETELNARQDTSDDFNFSGYHHP